MSPPQNPSAAGDWRFTWEAQSHIPTLRLYLFNSTNSTLNITSVNATLIVDQFILAVIFDVLTINVPVPRVLVDFEADIMCKAYDNYIEAKLVLLLPVDHPLLSDFEDKCNLEGNYCLFDEIQPLCMDYDLKRVSTLEEVSIYCRNCSVKLTRALRFFEEMPSVNWQDVADNWFGGCCCSFGGIGEKLVMRYARSYKHTPGVCLLSHTSVVLCTDDLVECGFSDTNGENDEFKSAGDEASALLALPVLLEKRTESFKDTNGEVGCPCPEEHHLATPETDDQISSSGTCSACCPHEGVVSNLNEQIEETNGGLLENQKSFLNGYLGNGFMEKSSGISKDIKWSEYLCPQCSHLLGGYPCSGKSSPLDGRVRLFKSYISTSLPVGGSNDVFRNYSLERMFTSQLLESAKDELSFRTVVSDLQTHDPVVQIILLNPNLWCYTGCCSDTKKLDMRIYMRPTVKVLFSACNNNGDSVSRDLKGWGSKDQADEVYMLPTQLEELIGTLELSKDIFPSSDIFLQGFSVSSLMR
ncbi:hypothetical protein Leryth_002523 [Lithospermum erythrorhizon]|nr:hypothetical protein Leryth_002523 [Lithospermum erythrorhizon]